MLNSRPLVGRVHLRCAVGTGLEPDTQVNSLSRMKMSQQIVPPEKMTGQGKTLFYVLAALSPHYQRMAGIPDHKDQVGGMM